MDQQHGIFQALYTVVTILWIFFYYIFNLLSSNTPSTILQNILIHVITINPSGSNKWRRRRRQTGLVVVVILLSLRSIELKFRSIGIFVQIIHTTTNTSGNIIFIWFIDHHHHHYLKDSYFIIFGFEFNLKTEILDKISIYST